MRWRVLVALSTAVVGCDAAEVPLVGPEPGHGSADVLAASTVGRGTGLSVRVSPKYATLYTVRGQPSRKIPYSVQVVDSAGGAQPLAVSDLRWQVAGGSRSGMRLGRPWVEGDGVTVRADAEVARAGRDTVRVLSTAGGAESGFARAVTYEWLDAVTRRPAAWTRPGESRCAEMGAEAASGEPLALSEFQHVYTRSLDPEIVSVDSTAFIDNGEAVRICVTGARGGTGRIALVAWDTLNLRYVGAYERHDVLVEPIEFAVEHGRWEIGMGQREGFRGRLTDSRGLAVVLPEGEVRSWSTSDGSVAEVDGATGLVAGVASGSARISATYLGQTARAEIEVYEIVVAQAGWGVICVLTRRGTIRCWGNGDEPKIGYGRGKLGALQGPDVADLPLGGRATRMFVKDHLACALLETAEVRCWGSAFRAQLGYGVDWNIGTWQTPEDAGPVPVGGPVLDFGVGDASVCVIMDAGRLRCWGYNVAGQLGYGSAVSEIFVGDDEVVADIGDVPVGGRVAQVVGGRLWKCALLDTGRVRCWGINSETWDRETRETGRSYGLGYGRAHGVLSPIGDDETPADIGDLPLPGRAVKLAGGGYHACALMEDGAVRCWGYNGFGALGTGFWRENIGDDETAEHTVPLRFPGTVVDIVAGYFHSCALLEAGDVYCWGLPDRGALGYGNDERIGDDETAASAGPVPLAGPAARLFAGSSSTCAVLRSGPLTCWGDRGDLSFLPEHVGDDETPADVDFVRIFPGPVTRDRIGRVEARRHSGSAPAVHQAPAAQLFFSDVDPQAGAQRGAAGVRGLPFPAVLAGVKGVLSPEPAAAPWMRVTEGKR